MKPIPSVCLLFFIGSFISCSSMQPDGVVKDLSEGDIFSQEVRDPGPVNNHIPEREAKPPMRWKMDI